jgi:EAL domain-containing protein (putative c-di-GMP-specific phosphodiesterase class I)
VQSDFEGPSLVPEYSTLSVHHASGAEFALRLIQPDSFRLLGEVTDDAASYNMRTLATAIRLLRQIPKCKRLFVPVEMETLDLFASEYTRMLLTIPEAYRSKMFLELRTDGRSVTEATANFSMSVQEDCGMSLAVWTKCNDVHYVDDLMRSLAPSVLGIERACMKQAVESGRRAFLLDTAEIGLQGGARVMAEGVDTQREVASLVGVGIDLLCGRAVSIVRAQPASDYRPNVALMSRHERRQRARA